MGLNLFSNLTNNIKDSNLMQNFIEELTESLENYEEENNLIGIEDIEKSYKLNSDSISRLTYEKNLLLQEYAENLNDDEKIYYVSYKNTLKNTYQIFEYDNTGSYISSYVSADELPSNISVGQIVKFEDNKFVLDEDVTKKFINELEKIAQNLSDEQENNLQNYRIEGENYKIVDFSSHGVYLQNIANEDIFEETSISKELLDKIGNDYVLKYENGEYIIDEELTKNFLK